MHFLPGTLRRLARGADGVYREGTLSLVSAQLTMESLLFDDAVINLEATNYDCSESAEFKLTCQRAARLYSETARNARDQKPSMIVAIVSICIACNAADSFDHGLLSAAYERHHLGLASTITPEKAAARFDSNSVAFGGMKLLNAR